MTEKEWLAASDPRLMLRPLGDKAGDRKLRLFCVACYQAVWANVKNERSQKALAVVERFAEGLASKQELASARSLARAAMQCAKWGPDAWAAGAVWHACSLRVKSEETAVYSTRVVSHCYSNASLQEKRIASNLRKESFANKCSLVRCIFGPRAFRPRSVKRTWFTIAVVSLTQAIYTDRAFDRLPILADALEEVGCTDEAILSHCRAPGPHVRGCWVVDLILGKE